MSFGLATLLRRLESDNQLPQLHRRPGKDRQKRDRGAPKFDSSVADFGGLLMARVDFPMG